MMIPAVITDAMAGIITLKANLWLILKLYFGMTRHL
jgi:hypothetical protein